MISKFKWIFTLLLAFTMQFSFAQEKTVTGVVSDKNGPLPGVNVLVKGTTRSAQTDFDGKYTIKAKTGEVLVFSFTGYNTSSVTIGAATNYKVVLSDGIQLGEVVVEGYKTTVKAKSNNATTTVTSKTITDRPNASFLQTLQGQIAGLNIATGSGQPGANTSVLLRGLGSINGNSEPLYVVDGVMMNVDNFRSLNPNDIETVSVLKDAGATAIYGNRGSNGVIVIKTRRADFKSKLKITYSSTTGFTEIQQNKYNLMSTKQLLQTEKAYDVIAQTGTFGSTLTDDEINSQTYIDNATGETRSLSNTKWQNEFFRIGTSQSHSLGIQTGSEGLSSFTSVGYFKQDGILENTGLNRFNFRSNLDGQSANKKFKFSTSTTINFSKNNTATSIGTGGVNQNYVLGANNSLPYLSAGDYINSQQVYNEYASTGSILNGNLQGTLGLTPLFLIDKTKTFVNRSEEFKMILAADLSYQIADNLTLDLYAGTDYTQGTTLTVQSPGSFNSLVFQNDTEETGFQSQGYSRDFQFNSNTSLNYSKTFAEKHSLSASVFMEYSKGHYNSFNYTQNGLDPVFFSPGDGSGFIPFQNDGNNYYLPEVGSLQLESGLFSYFGSADYDYNSKYGVGATVRRDASYRFIGSNKWGTFWSLSGRWNIDKEKFMEGGIFDALKLRGSIGTTGNQLISGQNNFNGGSLAYTLAAEGEAYGTLYGYAFGNLGNPDLKWETTRQIDLGAEFEMFKRRLSGTLDVYEKKTVDLIQTLPLSGPTGTSGITVNKGSLRNRGIELSLKYALIKNLDAGAFNLTLTGNGSYNKNEIVELSNDSGKIDNGLTILQNGHVMNEFYLVRYAGVNPANGNLLFLDKDGVPTENPNPIDDRVFTGKSSIPVYQGGFGFDATYHGFYLTSQFTFAAEVYRFDYDLSGLQDPTNLGTFNVSTDLLRAWTPDNRITDIPSLNATNLSLDSSSDRNLKDASYIRLRNLSFGYNVPKEFLSKSFITSLKIFTQAENYVTWSKWRGWDAESSFRGADQYQYPTPKILSFGVELQF